ncbi:hypothetical protein DTL21_08020 [Bremerella cremea]|uniref:Uncharacterized protein n=1 Tax=Blastopirellula marina TaxID=124 RepID=A0A2S8FUP7_9BACT|nr:MULTISPECIES: hypothetical protein [Pirellulaceae]PQO35873.1 hypothetical protein C5Y83_08015 [Blastopirellula marina]RCS48550.1 hypothetical protein DTL21_08020 [Bremerella cremea]
MLGYLRQSTADQSRMIGPFLDDVDGKTPETGLTIANTDIQIMANGAAAAVKNSGGATHRANGEYSITFNATDTANVGELLVSVVVAGALPVRAKFVVLEEAVFDALLAAGAAAKVDLIDQPNAAAITTVLNGLLDGTDGVETDWTLRQLARIALALFAGNSTVGGTVFANPAGNKTRIQSSVSSGNRTVSNLDVS